MTFIQTHSGKRLVFANPKPDQICIQDIATALSRTPRFAGHSPFFYSVAQHCVLMSLEAKGRKNKIEALLHDAAEAYIGDIPTPAKRHSPAIHRLEDKLLHAIWAHVGLGPFKGLSRQTKKLDRRMLFTEVKAFGWDWSHLEGHNDVIPRMAVHHWPSHVARTKFLDCCIDYGLHTSPPVEGATG